MRYLAFRQPCDLWFIFALACLSEILWVIFVNIGYSMDTTQYIRYANVLVGQEMTYQLNPTIGFDQDVTSVARRAIGYPLLLLLGGVPFTESLIGIVLIQAAMAVAMPLLAYKTLEPYGRRPAFIIALLLIVILETIAYSKTMLTEQSFKFLLFLLISLAGLAHRRPYWPLLAGTAATSLLLTLVRPQGGIAAVVVFGMLVVVNPRRCKSVAP
jgi:hypothetical protein